MKLRPKLSLWFVLVAMAVVGVNAAWIMQARATSARFEEYANWTTPGLIALGELKSSSLRMLSKAYQHNLLTLQMRFGGDEASRAVREREELEKEFA
ncbi:MAG TPA: hypothetical protein VGB20_07085, partial [bacterium]